MNCSFRVRNEPTAPHKRSITHLSLNKVCDCHSFKVNSKSLDWRIRTSQDLTEVCPSKHMCEQQVISASRRSLSRHLFY